MIEDEETIDRLVAENKRLKVVLGWWLEATHGTFDDEIEATQLILKDKP